jgi:hypothetical protein
LNSFGFFTIRVGASGSFLFIEFKDFDRLCLKPFLFKFYEKLEIEKIFLSLTILDLAKSAKSIIYLSDFCSSF